MESNTDTLIFEEEQSYYDYATTGQRFANYLIDSVVFYISYLLVMFLVGAFAQLVFNAAEEMIDFLQSGWGNVVQYLVSFTLYVIIFALIEGLSKGRTIGKLITKTVAVREDGSPISWKDAFMRSLCRIIPLEPFSGL